MLTAAERAAALKALPFLRGAGRQAQEDLFRFGVCRSFAAGASVIEEGQECAYVPFVLSGGARVFKTGESGREVTLYRIGRGESCMLTGSCVLSGARFPAEAAVESPSVVLLVPAPRFRDWMGRHEAWRTYVFALLSKRLGEVILTVEEIAFRRVDARLAARLASAAGGELLVTHRELAAEIGTAREVVSRLLKGFESERLIRVTRRSVLVLDRAGLERRAA